MRYVHRLAPPALICALIAAIALASAAADEPSEKRLSLASPPEVLPSRDHSCNRKIELVFQYTHHTFDLSRRCFYHLLFDTPKAVFFRNCAVYLSQDDHYYYYRDKEFDLVFAFGKYPKDHFGGHAIWSRSSGSTVWNLETDEGIMASPRVR